MRCQEHELMPQLLGDVRNGCGVEAGRENADMQEVASVVCALVSSVDEEAWREQLIGNTRRLLLPAAPAKVAAAANGTYAAILTTLHRL